MNTKYFSCSFQLQFNVEFIGKYNLVICQNVSSINKETKNLVIFSSATLYLENVKTFFLYNFPNCQSKCFKIVATQKTICRRHLIQLVGYYSQSSCQAKPNLMFCTVLMCSLGCANISDWI